MEIIVASNAGFCFGVARAVDKVLSTLDKGKTVCTLGPLIHNPHVIEELNEKGVKIIENISEAPKDSIIVIRAHGVPKSTLDQIVNLGIEYCDATCPFVYKIHNIVFQKSSEGNIIFIAGDKNHPEVIGIRGYCNGESYVFNSVSELEEMVRNHPDLLNKHIFVVSQTTFNVQEWQECIKKLKLVYTNATIFDTICNATEIRQNEAVKISKICDTMIVIGAKHSSNTCKLRDVCSGNCTTYLIEGSGGLNDIDFSKCSSIGVTAGASTPARIIKEVLETMSEIINEKAEIVNGEEVTTPNSEEMDFLEALEESLNNMSSEQKVKGVIVGISPNEIQVDIGRKHAGYIPFNEYSYDPKVDPAKVAKIGDVIDLLIMKTNDAEGTVMLSKRRLEAVKAWDDIIKASEEGTTVEGTVTDVIKGGILVSATGGVRVFIPSSLATISRNDSLDDLLNTKVQFKVIEVNKQRKRAVGSIKALLKDGRKESEEKFWAAAEVGQVYTGVVKSMTSYGAFVDIGGVDGMIHISELSWKRIKHPSDVLNIGDTVEVFIKALDGKKISLGYKKAEDNPWEILKRDYAVNSIITAKIVGMTNFGVFAQIIPGIDGLIHISQIADHHIEKPQDVLSVGEEVKVKITDIDFDKKRVSLSIRALIEPKKEEAVKEEAESVETTSETK